MSRFLPNFLRSKFGAASQPSVLVGLSTDGAAWLEHSPTGLIHWRTSAWQGATPSQALDALRKQLFAAGSTNFRFVLGPNMQRYWLQVPPKQVTSLNELREVAQVRCMQLFGPSTTALTKNFAGAASTGWSISGRWHASEPFICTALPDVWTDAIGAQSTTGSQNYDLVAIVFHHYRATLPTTGWLSVVVANNVFILYLQDRRVLSLREVRMARGLETTQIFRTVREEWAREMLRSNNSSTTLSCIYLHPDAVPSTPSAEFKFLTIPLAIGAPSMPAARIVEEDVKSGSADTGAPHDALLTAWCLHQFFGKSI